MNLCIYLCVMRVNCIGNTDQYKFISVEGLWPSVEIKKIQRKPPITQIATD